MNPDFRWFLNTYVKTVVNDERNHALAPVTTPERRLEAVYRHDTAKTILEHADKAREYWKNQAGI